MENNYFFVYIKPNCSGGKFLKTPISLFDDAGKCPLSIKERCKFSLVYEKCSCLLFQILTTEVALQRCPWEKVF